MEAAKAMVTTLIQRVNVKNLVYNQSLYIDRVLISIYFSIDFKTKIKIFIFIYINKMCILNKK